MMRSLREDTQGAVMVMAVFMAMIAIGSLYYLVGLGDAIVAHERMQDAADATAFSAAVIHARGMNLIALLNILMASLLAILVLFAMLASLFSWGAKIAAVGAIFFGFLAPAVPPMRTASKTFSAAEKASKGTIMPMIRALSTLQEPLGKAIPIMASLNALNMSKAHYGPVVEGGITFPILEGLPTEKASFDKLCTKAGEYAGLIVAAPIGGALALLPSERARNFLRDRIASGAKKVTGTYARFYCGDGKMPDPPSTRIETSIPEIDTDEYRQCQNTEDGDACEESQRQFEYIRGAYSKEEGSCQLVSTRSEGRIPDVQAVCNRLRQQARSECHPSKAKNDNRARRYDWRERSYLKRYRVSGEGLQRRVSEVVLLKSQRNETAQIRSEEPGSLGRMPCPVAPTTLIGPIRTTFHGKSLTAWNTKKDGKPVCQTKDPKPLPSAFVGDTTTIDIEVYEVTDILSCMQKRKVEGKLTGEAMEGADKKGMEPQEMCSCAALGEDIFQVRSVVYGEASTLTRGSDQRILVATDGRKPNGSRVGKLGEFAGRFAAAQAEFYYDDVDQNDDDDDGTSGSKPQEWLWHMKWKARMRRLSFSPSKWECPIKENSCKSGGLTSGLSGDGLQVLQNVTGMASEGLDGIIVH